MALVRGLAAVVDRSQAGNNQKQQAEQPQQQQQQQADNQQNEQQKPEEQQKGPLAQWEGTFDLVVEASGESSAYQAWS
jgi:hypothetical protein